MSVTNVASVGAAGASAKLALGFIGGDAFACTTHFAAIDASEAETDKLVHVAAYATPWKAQRLDGYFPNATAYVDYREMLARESLDAVICVAPDHLHAEIVVDCLAAGKHVYLWPPLCRYLPEAFEIQAAAEKAGKSVYVLECDNSMFSIAGEWVRAGKLGPLILLQDSYMRNSPKGDFNTPIAPAFSANDVNWEAWYGKALRGRKPCSGEEFTCWRKYYPYCSFDNATFISLSLTPFLQVLGHEEFPVRVGALGNKKFHTDGFGNTPERDCPETMQWIVEFPGGTTFFYTVGSVNEMGVPRLIRGHEASLHLTNEALAWVPEKAVLPQAVKQTLKMTGGQDIGGRFKQWAHSLSGNAKPISNLGRAVQMQSLLSLAEMSNRLNSVCLFDANTRKVHDGFGRELALPRPV